MYLPNTNVDFYKPNLFSELSAFREAKQNLERFYDRINLIGDIICEFDFHQRFGVSLLHKHFDILREEVLVKNFIDDRYATVSPKLTEEFQDSKAYLLKFERRMEQFYPLEYLEPSASEILNFDEDELARMDGFLDALGQRIATLEVCEIFGLQILHNYMFNVTEEDTLLETTNEEQKLLEIRAVNRSELERADTTQTLWIFTPSDCERKTGSQFLCKQHCDQHCKQHCRQHCKQHCKQHCRQHCKQHCSHGGGGAGPIGPVPI